MWKYFLLLFRATGHAHYAMETLTLLLQCNVFLPPNLVEQIKWSRFINVHGHLGRNISCDLHVEHLNRVVKSSMKYWVLTSQRRQVRVGRCVGKLIKMLSSFDKQVNVQERSGDHSEKSYSKDLYQVIEQLLESNALDSSTTHKSFSNLRPNLIRAISEKELKIWIIHNVSNYSSCH